MFHAYAEPSTGRDVAESRDQRETYLAQARDAELRAARTADVLIKEGWCKVAEGYRYLAQRLERSGKRTSGDPS